MAIPKPIFAAQASQKFLLKIEHFFAFYTGSENRPKPLKFEYFQKYPLSPNWKMYDIMIEIKKFYV